MEAEATLLHRYFVSTFEKISLDIVPPLFMVPSVLLFEAIVIVIEAFLIFHLMERQAMKAFAASFTANLLTGLLSLFYFLPSLRVVSFTYSTLASMIVVPLLINILVEAGVLKLFYRAVSMRKILKVSTIMNVASYVILIFNFINLL